MSSNPTSSSKRNKNRSNMPMSSNVHKPMNRNSIRNSNGQMTSSLNNYHNQVPQTPIQNNVSKYPNSISPNNNLDEIGTPNGVYKNGRLMHTVASLIGCLVEVQLANGERYEGILKTFSPEFDLVLFSAVKILNSDAHSEKSPTSVSNLMSCLESKSEIIDKLVVSQDKMVKIKALNVDLDYATSKKNVLIDSEIAKTDFSKSQNRELVPWTDDDAAGNSYGVLEENGITTSNGWDSSAMFSFNEKTYNLTSTYSEAMPEYTIQLDHRNDDDYRQKEAHAEKIAREIEKDVTRQNRLAKEDEVDDRDEETQFSAVVASKRDEANLPSNISSPRSEISHSSRDERRDLRNDGFRTQTSRRSRGSNRSSAVNDSNWRDTARDGRLGNSSRFNPSQPSSYNNNNFNAKSSNPPSGYAPSTSVPSAKYPPANNAPLNQFAPSSGPKSSYSAVSQRHTANDSLANENEAKSLPSNRGHGVKSEHYPNEDSYSRRSASGLPQRDNFNNKQRNSTSRNAEHDSSPKPSGNQSAAPIKSESEGAKTSLPANAPVLLPSPETLETPSAQPKVPQGSPAKSEPSSHQQVLNNNKNKSIDDSQPVNAPKSAAEHKKTERQSSEASPSSSALSSSEAIIKNEGEHKTDSPPPVSPVQSSATVSVPADSSIATPTATNTSSEIVKSSNLNPNAKSFTPRVTAPPFIPQNVAAQNAYAYQTHLATTPPAPQIQSQYIQIPMAQHHHQQVHQQQTHQQMARNYAMQFQPYNIIAPQMTPQYITNLPMAPMGPNGMPTHTVFSGPVPTGVPGPAPTAPPQNTVGPNQAGPGGQLAPHHMVSNAAATQQGVIPPNQGQPPQGGPQSRGPYRGGNKGGSSHNSGPNQVSQQYLRQPHHDYSQQSQVANVTGQPILAATAPQAAHQIPVSYSTAPPGHGGHATHHHHSQSQAHGQPPNLAAQMVPQPGQGIHYAMHYNFPRLNMIPQGHPQAINLAGPMQGAIYDPTMQMMMAPAACELPPQMVPPQSMATAVPQQNPNMQSAQNISSASVNPPNANQMA